MFFLEDFADKWNRPRDNNFAVACYEQNSLAELEAAEGSIADQGEMDAWGILDPHEWHDAIRAALLTRRRDRETS